MKIVQMLGIHCIVLIISAATLIAQSPPVSELRSSAVETMKPRNWDSEFYNELWTYHITLNNGYQVVYAFTITDFGNYKERVTGLKFQTTWLGGKHYVVRKEYDPEEFIYDSESNTIKLHPDRDFYATGNFNQTHRLVFNTTKDGNSYMADFIIYDMAEPQILGDGTFEVNGKKVQLMFPIPYGKVKGNLAVNGDTLKNIKGKVYMDHLVQEELGVNIFESGYRFSIGNAKNGMVATLLKPQKEDKIIGYGINYSDGSPTPLIPESHFIREKQKIRGNKFGWEITFSFKNHEPVTLTLDHILFDYSILDEISGLKKFFAKRILGGEFIEFNGSAHTADQQKVIFNYFITD